MESTSRIADTPVRRYRRQTLPLWVNGISLYSAPSLAGHLEIRVDARISSSGGVVAALLASVAGCASSLQLADQSAGKAASPVSLRDDHGRSAADFVPIPDGPRAEDAAMDPPRSSVVPEAESPVFASLRAAGDEQGWDARLVQVDRVVPFDEDAFSPSPLLPRSPWRRMPGLSPRPSCPKGLATCWPTTLTTTPARPGHVGHRHGRCGRRGQRPAR